MRRLQPGLVITYVQWNFMPVGPSKDGQNLFAQASSEFPPAPLWCFIWRPHSTGPMSPPVKNALHGLCKALRNYSNAADPRIFIANHLPRVSASPLRKQITQTNFILQQAVRSVGRSLGRVFKLSLYEHFTSRHGSLLKPVSKYFASEQLSYLGCLVMRECVLCEVGFKRYWFDRRPRRHQSKK